MYITSITNLCPQYCTNFPMMLSFVKRLSLATMAAILQLCLNHVQATNYAYQFRLMAAKHNITCVLVFGDSSVDPGNNNHIHTALKSNFPPYGDDFFGGQPTGRFCNGRLPTDFLVEVLGYTDVVRAFLDPNITRHDLLHGISFASAGSGYDPLTSSLWNVIPISKQLNYFRDYMDRLSSMVGRKEAAEIVRNALVFLSMGTDDFLLNYYIEPIRAKQYNIEQYQNFLISRLETVVKTMHSLGVRKLVVFGTVPYGCMPIAKTLFGHGDIINCDDELNKVAVSYNLKAQRMLKRLQGLSQGGIYVDVYSILLDAIENPTKYGFTDSQKGCCGSGTVEFAGTCGISSTCPDRSKYVFFDSIHPTERMYQIIVGHILEVLVKELF